MPPAILKAGSVMPNILKIRLPATAKTLRTIAQVHAERCAICRRSVCGESAVMAKNMGITAKGSTRKKTDVTASRVNSRTCVTALGICDRSAKLARLRHQGTGRSCSKISGEVLHESSGRASCPRGVFCDALSDRKRSEEV